MKLAVKLKMQKMREKRQLSAGDKRTSSDSGNFELKLNSDKSKIKGLVESGGVDGEDDNRKKETSSETGTANYSCIVQHHCKTVCCRFCVFFCAN